VSVAADGRARGKFLGAVGLLALLRDVDDAFAFGIAGTPEEGAETAMAERHGRVAGGTCLLPVEVGVVVVLVEADRFNGACVIAGGVVGTAIEVFAARPDLLKLVAAFWAVEFGQKLGNDRFFFRFLDKRNEVAPKIADELFPVLIMLRYLLELVFHLGRKGDVHDRPEILFEHLGDDFAELGRLQSLAFLDGVVSALNLIHDSHIGRGAADAETLKFFDKRSFCKSRRRFRERLVGHHIDEGERHVGFEMGQGFRFIFVFGSIFLLFINSEEAVELDGRASRAEDDVFVGFDIGRDGIINGGIHLRGDEAAPDEEIELILVDRQVLADPFRIAG